MTRTLRMAGLVVLFGASSVATAHADPRFSIHVGIGAAPVVVAPGPYGYDPYYAAPYPGYVWQPGYYLGYRWVPGGWVPRGRYAAPPYYGRYDWKRDRRDWERCRRDWEHDRRRWEHDRRDWEHDWRDWEHDRRGWERDQGDWDDDWRHDERDHRRW